MTFFFAFRKKKSAESRRVKEQMLTRLRTDVTFAEQARGEGDFRQ